MIAHFKNSRLFLCAFWSVCLVITSAVNRQITPTEEFLGFKPGADTWQILNRQWVI